MLVNNVVIVSSIQQSNSVIHLHVSIFLQIVFPFKLSQNIEQRFLCYTVGPCWLSILDIAVCTSQPLQLWFRAQAWLPETFLPIFQTELEDELWFSC